MDEPRTSPDRRLLVAGIVLVALSAAGTFLPRDPDLDLWFGVESFARLGPAALAVASATLLLVLLSSRLAGGAADALARAAARVPGPARTPLLLAGLAAAFLIVTNQRMSGDASTSIWITAAGLVYPSNALTCYLQQAVDALPGLDAREAVRLVSVGSGVVYALAVLGIAREVFPDGPRRVALAVLLLGSGSSALFFGVLEVYAPVAAAIAAHLLVGIRHRAGRAPWFLPPLTLGVAFTLHGSAGLLLPSLLLLANGDRLWPWRPRRWLAFGGVFLVPVVAVFASMFFLSWHGKPPEAEQFRTGSFLGAMGQGPLLPLFRSPGNLLHRYAIFDLEHLVGLLNLVLIAAPASAPLLVLGRWRGRSPAFAWTGSVAGFLVAFPVFWNISYPLRRDWDLFSSMGIPLALMAGIAFLGPGTDRRRALRVAALALLGIVPFVLANAGGRIEALGYAREVADAFRGAEQLTEGARQEECRRAAERWEERARDLDRVSPILGRAERLAQEGREIEAEAEYRRVLSIEPRNAKALVDLGIILWQRDRRVDGRACMEEAVRAAPNTFLPRMTLARSYSQEGRLDEAIDALERTARYGGVSERVVEALHLLGLLHRQRAEALAREGKSGEARRESDLSRLAFDLEEQRKALRR